MSVGIANLAIGFRPEEISVVETAFELAAADISKNRAFDGAVEAEISELVVVEAKRRLRLGLSLDNRRDAEVLAFMTMAIFFH